MCSYVRNIFSVFLIKIFILFIASHIFVSSFTDLFRVLLIIIRLDDQISFYMLAKNFADKDLKPFARKKPNN